MAAVAGIQALIGSPASSGVSGSADRATAGASDNAFSSQLRQNTQNATSDAGASGNQSGRTGSSFGKSSGNVRSSSSDVASAMRNTSSASVGQKSVGQKSEEQKAQASASSGAGKSDASAKNDSASTATSTSGAVADTSDASAHSDAADTKPSDNVNAADSSSDTEGTVSAGDVAVGAADDPAMDPALLANLQATAVQALPQDVSVSDDTVSSETDTSDSSDTQDTNGTDLQAASLLAAMFAAPAAAPAVSANTTATVTTSDSVDLASVAGVTDVSGQAASSTPLITGSMGASSTDTTDTADVTDGSSGVVDVSAGDVQDGDIAAMGRFAGLMRSAGHAGSDSATSSAADTSASGTTTTAAASAVDTFATSSSALTSAVATQTGVQPLTAGTAGLVSAKLTVSAQTASGSDEVSSLDTLGLSIAARGSDGVKHFAIRLDPPELGRVEVKLSVDSSGQASATLVAEKPHTLSLLQQDAGNLARTLQEAGMDLSNGGLNFSLSSGQKQNDSSDRNSGGQSLQAVATVDSEGDASSPSYLGLDSDDVRLDIKV